MAKNKWLRVRLNEQQDEVLERYASVQGISRSEVVRKMIDSLRTHSETNEPEFKFKKSKRGKISMEVTDSLSNKYILTVDYRPQFNLWRIVLHRLGRFNFTDLTAQVDLVKEKDKPAYEIWLNYIVPSTAQNWQETDDLLWSAVEKLRRQEGWKKMYGFLNLEMIENNPKQLSWLKMRGFNVSSQAEQKDFEFHLNF